MNIQHSELASLDWLMPLFKEYMTALGNQWQIYQAGKSPIISRDMAKNYHQLSGAMTMANMPLFASLATGLSILSQHIYDRGIEKSKLVSVGVNAHKLLQVELNKYALSGNYHKLLLISSIKRIAEFFADDNLVSKKLNITELNKLSPINSNLTKLVAVNDSIKQAQLLRQIRINLENIKNKFKHYINDNDVTLLPTEKSFDTIRDNLSNMKLIEVIEVVDEFIELFKRLRDNQLNEVSLNIIEEILTSINEFELFFDNLAQKIVNMEKLEETLEHINHTNSLLNQLLPEKNTVSIEDKNTEKNSLIDIIDGNKLVLTETSKEKKRFINHNDKNTPDNELDIQTAVMDVADKPCEKKEATAEIEAINTDEELLEIFLEEAHELEKNINKSFSIWKEETNNLEVLRELQRYLHTIKGGARMAGITSIGDLTHEIEAIYSHQ